ncbi:hypothetical protein JT05_13545 [Desulfosporosinus sp. Tol-M]|nr:hypothetical protein JT05_13545 [Desulfosporosinus sp. Tol-M]
MLTERFVAFAVRKKLDRYLRFDPHASSELPLIMNNKKPLMMYVHIPFCEELCPYCSFHRVTFREDLARAYFSALKKEIFMYKERGYNFEALYIGGGTPTVLMAELVEIIELIKSCFDVQEISVETNPDHLDMSRIRALRDIGVGRLSVGVQSFNDEILKATDRYYKYGSGSEVMEKIAELQGYFPTFNVDMIFNFPVQTAETLKRDLEIIRALKVDQVTYYPLMVATSTRKNVEKKLGRVDDERGRPFYELITEALSEDYQPSTAWCFNRKNPTWLQTAKFNDTGIIDEYVINYDQYAGIGSGALGYLEGSIYANTFNIPEYIQRVERGEFPIIARRDLSLRERLLYDFLMRFFGLSLDLEQMSKKHGVNAAAYLLPEILFFTMVGGIKQSEEKTLLKTKDQYYWVIMMREFFTAVNNFRDYCRSMT